MAVVGKNILENLTTGMYRDSKTIFREYVQNACDQIDLAYKIGLLEPGEERIEIFTVPFERRVCIRDNATGVEKDKFVESVGDIANSNKEVGKDKGFRGIGRLAGLAYCKILRFTTSYRGEDVKSIMTCDAEKMRKMLNENAKYTLDEVWDSIITYATEEEESDEHYFQVELIDVNQENDALLNDEEVRNYLSFVSPAKYANKFLFRKHIYEHAEKLGVPIVDYVVTINGAQIFKEYTTKLKEKKGVNLQNYDEILELIFEDFHSEDGELLAWMWYGLSRFEKQIPKENPSRGLRLRSSNIQIGSDNVLQELHKEARGNYYFVGEVFAVSKNLIPNSQRDYFNENETRVLFEDKLRVCFYDKLYNLYHKASDMRSDYKEQERYLTKVSEYEKQEKEGFVNEEHRQNLLSELSKAKEKSEKASRSITKERDKEEQDSPLAKVYRSIANHYGAEKLATSVSQTELPSEEPRKKIYLTDHMSSLTKKERKIVDKINSIICDMAPKDLAERIIARIQKEIRR